MSSDQSLTPPPLPEAPTRVSYQLSENEIVAGLLRHKLTRRKYLRWTTQGLLGVGLLLWAAWTPNTFYLFFFACLGTLLVLNAVTIAPVIRKSIRNVVRQTPYFTEAKTLIFDDQKLIFISPGRRLEIVWEKFKRLSQDESYLYLHTDDRGNNTTVPKRAFDDEQLARFLRFGQRLHVSAP